MAERTLIERIIGLSMQERIKEGNVTKNKEERKQIQTCEWK